MGLSTSVARAVRPTRVPAAEFSATALGAASASVGVAGASFTACTCTSLVAGLLSRPPSFTTKRTVRSAVVGVSELLR